MEILSHPNPALRQRAGDVEPTSDASLRDLSARMAEAMYAAPGIGLAATQIGVLKRLIVFDLDDGLVVLCNPRIAAASDEQVVEEEGCLSLPGLALPVARAASVTCAAVDLEGGAVEIEAEGMMARVLQHEVDHLDGVLVIDRATPDDRREALRRYNESRVTAG